MTSQVVRARKEVPARKAAAMRARALAETEALRGQDERRREVETQWREMKVEPMKRELLVGQCVSSWATEWMQACGWASSVSVQPGGVAAKAAEHP